MTGDVSHVTLSCELFEVSTAYLPFRRMLRSMLETGSELGHRDAGERLLEVVREIAPDLLPWLPLLAIVVDVEVAPTPDVDALGDEFRRPKLEEVTESFLERLVTDPIVVIVEDAHWMDEPSAGLLRRIAENVRHRPWLVCVTRRDVEIDVAHRTRHPSRAPVE